MVIGILKIVICFEFRASNLEFKMVVTSEDKNKIRIIFIGTPKFALPSLEALINDEQFDIIAVIAQPDKKVGRKQIVTSPVIKVLAEKNNIPVLQPQKISSSPWRDEILKLRPDIIVVAAYAQIIPRSILDIPAFGCINVHGSLLPRWRGASCIQAAIMNGDKKTGVTIIKMDAGLDTGPILAQTAVDILPTDTADSLYGKLAKLGAEMLIPTLKDYIAGKITPQPQDNSLPSYAGMLKKEDGKIDWLKTAVEIERFVRAMNPWPNAFASLKIKNKISKIKMTM